MTAGEIFDVAIVGGGLAGATLAGILGDAGLTVALIERQPAAALEAPTYDGRTTAITFGSRQILERAGLWTLLANHACAIMEIRVADDHSPLFLHFDSREIGNDALGWIIENRIIRRALNRRLTELPSISQFAPAAVAVFDGNGAMAELRLEDGQRIAAELVIGADGRGSFIRQAAGIETIGWKYGQQAIVTIIGHERPHDHVAVENFLPAGPFAMLPMNDTEEGIHRSSIVWTERDDTAPLYAKMQEPLLNAELQRRAGDGLGRVWNIGPRFVYPLSLRHALRYIGARAALIADAAHVIHPIAGQGLNLGMRDIGLLAELVIDRRRLGLDLGDPTLLREYEVRRRPDNFAFSLATDILDRLFSNRIPPIRAARRIGLAAVNRTPKLRRFFMRRAMGA
jgi:2-octaprenyl-6-methoxyphenol hydroxylase